MILMNLHENMYVAGSAFTHKGVYLRMMHEDTGILMEFLLPIGYIAIKIYTSRFGHPYLIMQE